MIKYSFICYVCVDVLIEKNLNFAFERFLQFAAFNFHRFQVEAYLLVLGIDFAVTLFSQRGPTA